MDEGKGVSEPKRGQVTQQLDSLVGGFNTLEGEINELQNYLNPILTPEEVTKEAANKPPSSAPLVPLADRIEALKVRVLKLGNQIKEIRERMEL